MLRDLGGLLYEVHRTGGGNVEAHATVVGAKVQRIAGLDAEAHALETALAAPRGETVVFEPGVGGTCAACGELYGSAARFCSNCGAAVGTGAPAPPPAPAATSPDAEEQARRGFWRRAARAPEPAPAKTDETEVLPPASGDETPGEAQDDAAAPRSEEPRNPGGHSNGRPQGDSAPGLSSGDPLLSRESRP